MDTGHWLIQEGINFDENIFGFIYRIENLSNNRYYIGKKQCSRRIKRKPLKGKTRNRIDSKESDWRTYTSSSNELNSDIQKFGKSNFRFIILKTCSSKWELAYEEIKEQLKCGVLMDENSYNGIINVRIGRPPKNLINL